MSNKTLTLKQLAEKMELSPSAAKRWIKANVDNVRFPLDGRRKKFFTPNEINKIFSEFND